MSTDAPGEAALRIASFITTQLDYPGAVADLVGYRPVRLTEALDSIRLMELASFLEDSFGVQIRDDEIVPENFATVAAVVKILRDKGAIAEDRDGRRS
jgi:acyl carrier protein